MNRYNGNRRPWTLAAALLCGALLLAGCPVGLINLDGFNSSAPKDSTGYIIIYNLQNYVPVPVEGEAPVKRILDRGDMTVEVSWLDEQGTPLGDSLDRFAEDHVYQAEIRLVAKQAHSFDPGVAFYYPPGTVGDMGEDRPSETERILTVTYKRTGRSSILSLDRFAGDPGDTNSAIDLIRWAAGQEALNLELRSGTEPVELKDGTDLGTEGLVLMYNDSDPTASSSPANVTINGGGRVIDLTGTGTGSPLITVDSGVALTLRNITLKGLDPNIAPLILVKRGGTFIMEDGVEISDNVAKSLTVLVEGGESEVYFAGGVNVEGGGSFTMNGGTIRDNTSEGAGGGVNVEGGGNFTMNGGTIRNNTSEGPVGGVYVSGEFTMNMGTIRNNKGEFGGVYAKGGWFLMNDGTISGNEGANAGGVGMDDDDTVFIMNNGTIRKNTATDKGGGVFVGGGNFTMNLGTISENTTADTGGGVYVGGGTFNMTVGIIGGNEAKNNGGGVYMGGQSMFNFNNGIIKDNTVTEASGNGSGGGVYVKEGVFTMNAGSIQHNGLTPRGENATTGGTGKGCGVYVAQEGKFHKNGGIIYGVAKNKDSWETAEHQNYYNWGVRDPTPAEHPHEVTLPPSENYGDTPGGPGRGYAVYWQKNDDYGFPADMYRDETKTGPLSTEGDEGWGDPDSE